MKDWIGMNRTGHKTTNFFEGVEVERTPAHGMKTLFVVGVHPVDQIKKYVYHHTQHIFFGANHSFNSVDSEPDESLYDFYKKWEDMIEHFLNRGYLCTLDIPVALAEEFLESSLVEHNNFIPQLRISLPYIQQWNYNTMIKLDDRDFASTNPGVWCHNLHDLMDRSKYTNWNEYADDEVLEQGTK